MFVPVDAESPAAILFGDFPLGDTRWKDNFATFNSSIASKDNFPMRTSVSFSVYIVVTSTSSALP